MAGNSARRGARRNPGSKKGAVVGSGGNRRRGLEGKGPTPKAEFRTGHPAHRRAVKQTRQQESKPKTSGDAAELLVGRNPVVEALRAKIPATALYLAVDGEADDRIREAVHIAADRGLSVLEVSRAELNRMTGNIAHQGVALKVPPFSYQYPDELLTLAQESDTAGLLVALDGVTDPRNVGALVRSSVTFGAHGLVVPARRAAGITAAAWRTSAGTAAKLPIAQATNVVRTLNSYRKAGFMVIGLDAHGSVSLDEFTTAVEPLVLVVGSEDRGLSRLVGETCDQVVSIPMAAEVESLNVSVAGAVALAEIARRRRLAHGVHQPPQHK